MSNVFKIKNGSKFNPKQITEIQSNDAEFFVQLKQLLSDLENLSEQDNPAAFITASDDLHIGSKDIRIQKIFYCMCGCFIRQKMKHFMREANVHNRNFWWYVGVAAFSIINLIISLSLIG